MGDGFFVNCVKILLIYMNDDPTCHIFFDTFLKSVLNFAVVIGHPNFLLVSIIFEYTFWYPSFF